MLLSLLLWLVRQQRAGILVIPNKLLALKTTFFLRFEEFYSSIL
jgi:hypothetical protein